MTPKGEWCDVRIEITDFLLTSRGLINTEKVQIIKIIQIQLLQCKMKDEKPPIELLMEVPL